MFESDSKFRGIFAGLSPNIKCLQTAICNNDLPTLTKLITEKRLGALLINPLILTAEIPQTSEYEKFTLLHYACAKQDTSLEVLVYLITAIGDPRSFNLQTKCKKDGKFKYPWDFLNEEKREQVLLKTGLKRAALTEYCYQILFAFMALTVTTGFVINNLDSIGYNKNRFGL